MHQLGIKEEVIKHEAELETHVSQKILGHSKRKRHWGRHMIIDSWEKLEEVIELIKVSLPINMQVDLNGACRAGRNAQPLPFDPRTGNPISYPAALPALAEVRVALFINEALGWLLPLRFCIGQLLTATEIIGKVAHALFFLESWSHAHSRDARAQLRFEHPQPPRTAKSNRKPSIQ